MTERSKALAGKKIGLFGRGGCGKSTTIVLLAKALRKYGYDVCVLDADSTNAGLAQALGAGYMPDSLLDYYGGMVFSGGTVTCPVDDPKPLADAEISLGEISSAYYAQNGEGISLFTAGKLGDQGVGAGCDGPIGKIARDVRIRGDKEDPVTLVDFKAGFEDSARGIITGLDFALVIVDPTVPSIQMAVNMRDMVDQLKAGGLPATKHLGNPELIEIANATYRESRIRGVWFVLNKIQRADIETYLRSQLTKNGIEPTATLPDDPKIAEVWLKGEPLELGAAQQPMDEIIKALEVTEATHTNSEKSAV